MKRKKENIIKENFKESLNYMKKSRNYIYFIIAVFLISVFIGAVYPHLFEEVILNYLKNLFEEVSNYNFIELLFYIIKNNIIASLIGLALGVFFGIFPFIIAVVNGYVLGFVSIRSIEVEGPQTLLRLVPHGIFELPALFISLGLGIRLGVGIFFSKDEDLTTLIKKSLKTFIFIVIPLLIIAGIIETSLIFLLR